jgi:helix-turn-helix protein
VRDTTVAPAALSIADAAKSYGVSTKTIRGAIASGALPAKVIGAEGAESKRLHARVAVADLQAWWAALPDA